MISSRSFFNKTKLSRRLEKQVVVEFGDEMGDFDPEELAEEITEELIGIQSND